jgi:predicted O-methyltransferase YrrM
MRDSHAMSTPRSSRELIPTGPEESTPARVEVPGPAGQLWAETVVPERPDAEQARAAAARLGVTPVSPGVATALTFLAATIHARTVVELGTGTGVSALALLSGMTPDGVLTSVDIDGENQRPARAALTAAGIPATRARLIAGRALAVVPRLTDGAYDLVFLDADPAENAEYVRQAARLLRPGGLLAVHDALWGDAVADPARRDPATIAARDLATGLIADERFVSAVFPLGAGLLVGVLTG